MKKILSVFLTAVMTLCLVLASAGQVAAFSDIGDPHVSDAACAIETFGIAEGIGGDLFSPDGPLTRAQFCTMLIKAMGLDSKKDMAANQLLFSDVVPGTWYAGYVNLAYEQGMVSGYPNGTFRPVDPVNYDEACAMILKVMGYGSSGQLKYFPQDYVAYAHYLEFDENLTVSAETNLTRGQAAVLVFNALQASPYGAATPFYMSLGGSVTVRTAILASVSSDDGSRDDKLKVCLLDGNASIAYYEKKNNFSAELTGVKGQLLLGGDGKACGFIPEDHCSQRVTIASADLSGITASDGSKIKISSSAKLILGDELVSWNGLGHAKADSKKGCQAMIYTDDDGAVTYVLISAPSTSVSDSAAVCTENGGVSGLLAALGAGGADAAKSVAAKSDAASGLISITKNNFAATAADVVKNDVAVYDELTGTLRVSDFKLTGVITSASPAMAAAETLTVGGCTLQVMEGAREELALFRPGDRVTLLLTDDGLVASVKSTTVVSGSNLGILSGDGQSVTLCGSGLVLRAGEVDVDEKDYGRLVTVSVNGDELVCKSASLYAATRGMDLNCEARTLGELALAPDCQIYEQTGGKSFLTSLDGSLGIASTDFDDLLWTKKTGYSAVAGYLVDGSGKVNTLVLNEVTGNGYAYGEVEMYEAAEGINLGSGMLSAMNSAATLSNAGGTSAKYLCAFQSPTTSYRGIALSGYSAYYQNVCSLVNLAKCADRKASDFTLDGDDWYVAVDGVNSTGFSTSESAAGISSGVAGTMANSSGANGTSHAGQIRISPQVQVYFASGDYWVTGDAALTEALSSGLNLNIYYDRTPATGGQVRIVEAYR